MEKLIAAIAEMKPGMNRGVKVMEYIDAATCELMPTLTHDDWPEELPELMKRQFERAVSKAWDRLWEEGKFDEDQIEMICNEIDNNHALALREGLHDQTV
jgi:hypothetical protein